MFKKLVQLKHLPLYLVAGSLLIGGLGVAFKDLIAKPLPVTDCREVGKTHVITASDEAVKPKSIRAKVCDRLTIINRGPASHKVAFGSHDSHISYPGFKERQLGKDKSMSFVLVSAGKFEYHDHFDEDHGGTITIEP